MILNHVSRMRSFLVSSSFEVPENNKQCLFVKISERQINLKIVRSVKEPKTLRAPRNGG